MNIKAKALSVSLFFLVLIVGQDAFAAGAWAQDQGEFYAKISNMTLLGSGAFDLNGDTLEVQDYHLISLDIYAEAGLGKQWTAVVTGRPIGSARYGERRVNFLGPLSLWLRRSVSAFGWQFALEGAYGFQGLNDRNLAPEGAPVVFRPTVPTQNGQLELAVGKGLRWGWITGSVGAKAFTNETISTAILASAQVGYRITPKLMVDARLGLNQHVGQLDELNVTGAGETNYLGIGLGLSYWFSERVGVNIGADGVAFAQSNAATPALMFGVEVR